jgi:hypothetical protein
MRRIIFFITIIITVINLTAQIDTTRKEFYPLQIGNLWQYRDENNNLAIQQVVGDTILDGDNYFTLVHSLRTSGGGITRIDSLLRVQNRIGSPNGGDSCGGNTPYELSIYHLNEPDSTAWEICEAFSGHLGYQLIRFNSITIINIFGQLREAMHFDYGGALPGEDTVWAYGASLVKGIGVIEEQYFDGSYNILQGAIIDGVQYGTIVSVDEITEIIPKEVTLYQNYPNPFNPTTTIRYEITKATNIKLKVINILGEEITELVNEIKYPRIYEIEFDGRNLSSGVYIAVLQTNEAQLTKVMLLIK